MKSSGILAAFVCFVLSSSVQAAAVALVGTDIVNPFVNRINNMYNRVVSGAAAAGTPYDAVDVFNTSLTSPTLSQVQNYDTLLVWAGTPHANAAALGDLLADYVDGGGNVVIMSHLGVSGPTGRWASGGYDPLVTTGYTIYTQSILPGFDGNHPLFDGVSTLVAEYKNLGTARNGATVYASYAATSFAPETPLLLETTAFAGRVRNLNMMVSDFWPNTYGDINRLIYNAINAENPLVAAVPEPSSLMIASLIACCAAVRRKRTADAQGV